MAGSLMRIFSETMMLNDSNYPVMTVRQAIDEAIAAAPQEVK